MSLQRSRNWFAAASAAAFLFAGAAPAGDKLQRDTARLFETALASRQSYETLSQLTDGIGPRLSGSDGAAAAVDWTTSRFRAWGIDARTERVMVPHWVRGVERASLVSHPNQKIALTALGGSVATPAAGITAPVVEVRSFDELKTLGRSGIAGRIVFYSAAMDMDLVRAGHAFTAYGRAAEYRSRGADRAAEFGAVAVITRSLSTASLRTPHTGALHYEGKQRAIPAAAVSAEDALLMQRLLARGEDVRMHLLLTPRTLPDVASANVVAEIRGSEKPDEIVLIGAHLDSWDLGTGAIDDGSGVAMVMDTMRIIKASGLRPNRTIRCVLFMNEENGLRGGRAYLDRHRLEIGKHVAAIEADAGAAAPRGFITTLKSERLSGLAADVQILNRVGANVFDFSEETGADTSFLTEGGVTGFGLIPDQMHYFDYHHSPADTLDKVDPAELAQNTAAVTALAWVLANR